MFSFCPLWRAAPRRPRRPPGRRDGTHTITLTTDEFLTRLCALIPPPRVHQTRYHGIFAPRARGRAALTGTKSTPRTCPSGTASQAAADLPSEMNAPPPNPDRPLRLPWTDLLRRVYELDLRSCPRCGASTRVVAYLTDPAVTQEILVHLGLPALPPPRGPPRRRSPRCFDAPDPGADSIDPPPPD